MYKRSSLHLAIAAALALPVAASANFLDDLEISGYVKNESAFFLNDGMRIGQEDSMISLPDNGAGDLLKFENSARFFVNGALGEDASWHLDLNMICDTEGVNSNYKCHESYTQNDWLRELYFDATTGPVSWRVGKQQVVWGTADGIKLLDIINPTDYRELVQNAMEDSRINLFMINAEIDVGDSGNIQFIVSENRPNYIPGINDDGDHGQPFTMKGVDSITGNVNGFLHVTPALAKVATSFTTGATLGMINGAPSPLGLVPATGITVDFFAGTPKRMIGFFSPAGTLLGQFIQFANPDGSFSDVPGGSILMEGPGYIFLNEIAQNGLGEDDPNGNNNVTNLMDVFGPQSTHVNWDPSNPNSAFEYMGNTTFSTFNTFGANVFIGGTSAGSRYVVDEPDASEPNAGLRYRGSLANGLNFGLNYFYHYSNNPEINTTWNDAVTGEELVVQRALPGDFISNSTGAPGPDGVPDLPNLLTDVAASDVSNNILNPFTDAPSILLHNGAGEYYGAYDPTAGFGAYNGNGVTLNMTETRSRVHSLGGSFDYAFEAGLPFVVRGELLYDKDEKQPIIDKRLMGIGDLTNTLVMEDMDKFSYVLGLDTNVMTNMMISAQFIQMNNLDYVDEQRSCTTQTGIVYDCSRYTGDFATLHMTNGMNQGWEHKEFYSLFFSKPFGESQLGRWNNITMYEEGGGWWNRFDVEYSFTDQLVGSAELNVYWGDENTQFGQFSESSNIQLGVKYIWER